MKVRLHVSSIHFENSMNPAFKSVYHVPEGVLIDGIDFACDGILQFSHSPRVVALDFVFKVAPKKEVTWVQIWAVRWPVHSSTEL